MRILAIDTSTRTAAVALLQDEVVLAETMINTGLHHSVILIKAIDFICHAAGEDIGRVDLFVCTQGPGSFTGLRIGAGTIKGFALVTGKPLIGVSTLEALAFSQIPSSRMICPMLDAQKGQVYTALYASSRAGNLARVGPETLCSVEEFVKTITDELIFVGEGALTYADRIKNILGEKAFFASHLSGQVRASVVGILGLHKFRRGDTTDPLVFAPHYIRLPEAEAQRAAGNHQEI